jgi:hypothetical protein
MYGICKKRDSEQTPQLPRYYLVQVIFPGQSKVVQLFVLFAVVVRVSTSRKVGTTHRHPTQTVLDSVWTKIRPQQFTLKLLVQRIDIDSVRVGESAAPTQNSLVLLSRIYVDLGGGVTCEVLYGSVKSQPGPVGRVDDELGSFYSFGSWDCVAMGQVAYANGTIVTVVSARALLALQRSCKLILSFGSDVASTHQEKLIEQGGVPTTWRGNRERTTKCWEGDAGFCTRKVCDVPSLV